MLWWLSARVLDVLSWTTLLFGVSQLCFTALFHDLLIGLAGMHLLRIGMHSVDVAFQCGCGHQPECMLPSRYKVPSS